MDAQKRRDRLWNVSRPVSGAGMCTCTRKGLRLFVHLLTPKSTDIFLPAKLNIRKATVLADGSKVRFSKNDNGVTLHLDAIPDCIDHIIELEINQPVK